MQVARTFTLIVAVHAFGACTGGKITGEIDGDAGPALQSGLVFEASSYAPRAPASLLDQLERFDDVMKVHDVAVVEACDGHRDALCAHTALVRSRVPFDGPRKV